MSEDLRDIKRLKITEATALWLEAEFRFDPSRSKQEILRDALHELALREQRRGRLLAALAPAEGTSRDGGGRAR